MGSDRVRADRPVDGPPMASWVFPAGGDGAEPSDVLTVTLRMHDATTVVSLDGPVCAYTAPHLDAELAQIERVDRHRLVIEASRVRTLSVDGIDVLTDHARRCGGDLVIRDASPVVQRVLAVLDLEWLLEPTGLPVSA